MQAGSHLRKGFKIVESEPQLVVMSRLDAGVFVRTTDGRAARSMLEALRVELPAAAFLSESRVASGSPIGSAADRSTSV